MYILFLGLIVLKKNCAYDPLSLNIIESEDFFCTNTWKSRGSRVRRLFSLGPSRGELKKLLNFSQRDMRIFARGAKREKDGPAPISAGRDPISPSVGKTKSLARSLYALSPPRGNKRAFSLFTPPEILGSYLPLQFSASLHLPSSLSSSLSSYDCLLSAEVDRSRSIGARRRRKFIVNSLSSTSHDSDDVAPAANPRARCPRRLPEVDLRLCRLVPLFVFSSIRASKGFFFAKRISFRQFCKK